MSTVLRIGTRDSELAVWQATLVQNLLKEHDVDSELVYMKSEGDIDTITPLYALGVQGVFTKVLDAALLNKRIDIAVHSMKDVPTQMAQGLQQAAVLKRANYKDIFVYKEESTPAALGYINGQWSAIGDVGTSSFTIATGSVRRIAQWLHRYPSHMVENLRGNVNTRLRKVNEHTWKGAIFAAAGLERIGLRPENSIDLDWMLPAPAQGAIMIACREGDELALESCKPLNDEASALCTFVERDFLSALMGGCSTPISALAEVHEEEIHFKGNIVSPDGKHKAMVEKRLPKAQWQDAGHLAAASILVNGGQAIINGIRKTGLTTNGNN
jgi:hydroxymethylbilane synthase